MEAAEDAEASVLDAVEHMADDIKHSREDALAAAVAEERAARMKHLRAAGGFEKKTDTKKGTAAVLETAACVDAREEECAR